MRPQIGDKVIYRMKAVDEGAVAFQRGNAGRSGNPVAEGQEFPAFVVAVFAGSEHVNLHVLLDGPDAYWAASRLEGTDPGTWSWPVPEAARAGEQTMRALTAPPFPPEETP